MLIEKLRNTLMFSSFHDDEIRHLPEMTHIVRLNPGDSLFQQGQEFRSFYFVNSGIIKLSRLSEDGLEKVIELIRPEQFFAEALVFLRSPHYPDMATAMKDTELVAIDAQKYAALLHNSADSCFKLLGSMSQRIHGLISDIDSLTLHSSKSRLAGYLIKCLSHYPDGTVNLELPKGVIASRLSMKPETFSRALHSLDETGVITVNKRMVTINDEQALQEIANQEQDSSKA